MNNASASYRLLPGAPDSPVILHVPHSSRAIPADVRSDIVLEDADLERELGLPYELHGDGPRPPICLGRDGFHTPADLLALAEKAFGGFGGTGVNSPFEGAYVPLKYHGNDPRVGALMIEIRRDVHMAEPGGPPGPGLDAVADALAELVDTAARTAG